MADRDVVERLRELLTPVRADYVVTRVVLGAEEVRAVLARLECAEDMVIHLEAVSGMCSPGSSCNDAICELGLRAEALIAKWEAMKRG